MTTNDVRRTTGTDEIRVDVPRPVARSRRGKVLQRSRTSVIREARRQDPRVKTWGVQSIIMLPADFTAVFFTDRFPAEDGLQ